MGIKHDCPEDKKKEEEKKKEDAVPTMNKKGHLRAGNNSPDKEEPKVRTDLAHTIAHAAGISHDCLVKEPKKETEKDLKNTPDI
jgi:hypothetical protein